MLRRLALFSLCALALAGCSSGPKVEGAVYAGAVPVFKSATFDGEMGGDLYGDEPGSHSKSRSWFYKTDAPLAEVVSFYEAALPNATRDTGAEGEVIFQFVPEHAKPGELVEVWLSEGSIQIREQIKPESAAGDGAS